MKQNLKRNFIETNHESGDEIDDEGFPMLNEYDNTTLKAGKWSVEEEIYCKQLIDAFENGKLPDCMEGSSLRAYLAKKLNCSPMRISKKFAGLGIGKVSNPCKIYRCHAPNQLPWISFLYLSTFNSMYTQSFPNIVD